MYERFTDQARQAMQLANREAMHQGRPYIGCEHILYGILAQGDGVVEAFESLGVPVHRIRQELRAMPEVPRSESHTSLAKRAIEFAIEESRNLRHLEIGTHHMLLGILRVPANPVVVILERVGLDADRLRGELLRRFPAGDLPPEPPMRILVKRFENRSDVRVFQQRIGELQQKLEEAITAGEFEAAARYRDEKVEVRATLRALLERLQKDSIEGA